MKTKAIQFSSALAVAVLVWSCGNNESSETNHESGDHQHSEGEAAATSTPSLINPVVQHLVAEKHSIMISALWQMKIRVATG